MYSKATRRQTRHVATHFALASSTISASSPVWYISSMMSDPPTNSPPTYSCGIVGQLEYALIPLRMLGSSRTFTVSYGVSSVLSIRQAVLEKPLHRRRLSVRYKMYEKNDYYSRGQKYGLWSSAYH